MCQAYSRESDVELAASGGKTSKKTTLRNQVCLPGHCIAQCWGHHSHIIQHKFHPLELCNGVDQSLLGARVHQERPPYKKVYLNWDLKYKLIRQREKGTVCCAEGTAGTKTWRRRRKVWESKAIEKNESWEVSRSQTIHFLWDHVGEVDSYPKECGNPLKGFKQGNNMIIFAFWLLCGKWISWE